MTLIGATTENPYFEVNSALLSRMPVYELEALSPEDVRALLDRAVQRGELGDAARIDAEALEYAAEWTRATRARAERRSSWPPRPPATDGPRDGRADRGRACRGADQLRPPGRRPLRHDLRLDQGDARLATCRRRSTTWR